MCNSSNVFPFIINDDYISQPWTTAERWSVITDPAALSLSTMYNYCTGTPWYVCHWILSILHKMCAIDVDGLLQVPRRNPWISPIEATFPGIVLFQFNGLTTTDQPITQPGSQSSCYILIVVGSMLQTNQSTKQLTRQPTTQPTHPHLYASRPRPPAHGEAVPGGFGWQWTGESGRPSRKPGWWNQQTWNHIRVSSGHKLRCSVFWGLDLPH